MKIIEDNPELELLDQKIDDLFFKLDELDQNDVRKRLIAARKVYLSTKRLLKDFRKYENIIKRINLYKNKYDSLKSLLLAQGFDENKASELEEIYYEYLELKEKIAKSHQQYKIVLEEFQSLLSNNYEYSKIYDQIVKENEYLVKAVVNRFLIYVELPYDDAIGVAYEGLSRAILNYKCYLGARFSRYALKIMKRMIPRNFKSLTGQNYKNYLRKKDIEKELNISFAAEKTTYTIEDIAQKYGKYKVYQIAKIISSNSKEYGFLDVCEMPDDSMTRIKGNMPTTQADYDYIDEFQDNSEVIDENGNIASILDYKLLKDILEEALQRLPEKNRRVIELYYYEQRTLEEIGEIYNITYEGVRLILESVKKKIRISRYRKKLQPFCDGFKYFKPDKIIVQSEILALFKKLYQLRSHNLSNEARALFCSTANISLTTQDVEEIDALINTFLINMQLDENSSHPTNIIVDEFYNNYSESFSHKYPFRYQYWSQYEAVFQMLQELIKEDEAPDDIKELLNKPHLNTLINRD